MHRRVVSYMLILLLITGVITINGCSKSNKAVSVTTVPVQNQAMEMNLELSGVLLPAQTVDVSGKVSAQVLSLGFTVGSPVKQGDVLITLDSEAINGQLMSARATLENARAAAGAAENQAALAQLNLAAAQRSFDRTKALFESGAVPRSQYE
ncbi:MAG: biotin/lipoyl-binding protein, partial [Syntrophomonas sp.]